MRGGREGADTETLFCSKIRKRGGERLGARGNRGRSQSPQVKVGNKKGARGKKGRKQSSAARASQIEMHLDNLL